MVARAIDASIVMPRTEAVEATSDDNGIAVSFKHPRLDLKQDYI